MQAKRQVLLEFLIFNKKVKNLLKDTILRHWKDRLRKITNYLSVEEAHMIL